ADARGAGADVAPARDGFAAGPALEVGTRGAPSPADRRERIVVARAALLVATAAALRDRRRERGGRLADRRLLIDVAVRARGLLAGDDGVLALLQQLRLRLQELRRPGADALLPFHRIRRRRR